ncbi:MAG TPA: succinate dehydrogenase assembly factor 2 [Burkholderiales bacterium]|nr:succinate dehydrogenase assembly factor 2 [Burkholderiales bacterium]
MDPRAREKLKWKCRRGLLELDLVFQRFVPTLKDEETEPFAALLDLPDNDLWDIVAGRSEDYAPRLSAIVARVRAA